MKKYLLMLSVGMFTFTCNAQNGYTIGSSYESLPVELMMMSAQAKVNRFNKYQEKAYECIEKEDYKGFLYYSDIALKTGYYNAEMYYNRGVAYEELHEYYSAKKEYNRALKKGCYEAKEALEQLKINQQKWEETHK